jgi:hypothetical protein
MGNCTSLDEVLKNRDSTGKAAAAEKLLQTPWHGLLDEFKKSIEGTVLLPTDADEVYTEARNRAWNMDQRGFPLVIIRVKHTADVVTTVNFIRNNIPSTISVCVACGCHSSKSMVTDTIVIDLVQINQVKFEEETGRIHVGGGAYLENVDNTLKPFNRAVPVGTYPKTGVGGLTLGGGYGWLSRMYGLTVDNLLEAEVVLSNGEVVIAQENTPYADLLWGLRGGGGNFGIVTKFIFQSHQLPPHCIAGNIVKFAPTRSSAMTVLQNVDAIVSKSPPKELVTGFVLPAGAPVVVTLWAHFGNEEKIAQIPILQNTVNTLGGWFTLENSIGKKTYHQELQHFTEPMNPAGFDYHTVIPFGTLDSTLPPEFFDRLLTFIQQKASPKVEKAAFIAMGLSSNEVVLRDPDNNHTAVPQVLRRAKYFGIVQAAWSAIDGDSGKEAAKSWVKTVHDIILPYKTGNLYASDEINAQANASSGAVLGYDDILLPRLTALKGKYDATNFFHMNTNIIPTTI